MKRFLALLSLLLAPTTAAAQPTPTYQWVILAPRSGAPAGVANGTCWTQSTGLFCYINGATVGPYIPAAGAAFTIGGTAIVGGVSGRVLYDNAGIAGEYTATQLTAQINAFTSSLAGVAPASGGGTTNFLRADGTWVAPPGGLTLAGSSGNVQTNNGSGNLGALTNTQLTADINVFTSSLSGAAPSSGGGTSNFLRADGTWAVPPGTGTGTVTTTGTPASGNLAAFSGATSITNGNLSGDVTTSGTLATVVGNLSGVTNASLPNTGLAHSSMTIGGQSISLGGTTTNQGTGAKLQLSTGTVTSGHCADFDASGNTVDSGAPCGTGSGTITGVTAGTGLSGGGASGSVTVSLSTPVSVANGGTGASLASTGGTSQVLKQTSSGGNITVGQLSCTDLSGGCVSGSSSVTVNSYTSNGTPTWTKPSICNVVIVIVQGAGGSGGGGAGAAVAGVKEGGSGGGGGARTRGEFRCSDLTSTVTVTVGAGGTAGTGTASGAGGNGNPGAASSFGAYLQAFGGGAGFGGPAGNTQISGGGGGGSGGAGPIGVSSSANVGGAPFLNAGGNVLGISGGGGGSPLSAGGGGAEWGGGGGGAAGGNATANAGGSSLFAAGGGGGGGGFVSGVNSPAAGGSAQTLTAGGGGAAGSPNGGTGTAGDSTKGGAGGGGGAATNTAATAGGTGGPGATCGGGGGGGGGGVSTGGNGGAGADGCVFVFAW